MLLKTFESRRNGWEFLAVVLACAVGCGPAEELPEEMGGQEEWGSTAQEIIVGNGLSLNGLSLNGLTLTGLATSSFNSWFQGDPTVRNEVMKYVVACAVPSGQTRSYTGGGTTYTWNGLLGLAPGWASGTAATTAELQVVSGCMAAHANKFGINVTISLLGLDGAGNTITYTTQELADYNVKEACFFGNLFDGSTGVYGGNDGLSLTSSQSNPRVCGLAGSPNASQCTPMTYVGSCSNYCTRDGTNTFYTTCTYNGVTYRPITTRMKPSDFYTCGDGVCQATESCGTGTTAKSCAADCGSC